MTMTDAPDRAALQKMKVADLRALAGERGLTLTGSEVKAQLVHMLTPSREITDFPARPVPSHGEAVEIARRFLDRPNAEDQEALHAWAAQATAAQYEQVMAEARGGVAEDHVESGSGAGSTTTPKPYDDGVDRSEAQTALEKWRDTAEGAEMEPYRPTLLPSPSTWQHINAMARDLSSAVALPPAIRGKPADIALVLLTGRDVGVGPTTAINKIYVIDGRPSMAPELMRALIIDRGHDIWFEEVTPTSVTIAARRSSWPKDRIARVTWTLEDAKKANLIKSYDGQGTVVPMEKREVWRKFTRALLKARATSEMGRDNFSDVLLGVSYTPEELDADVDELGVPVPVESTSTVSGDTTGGEGVPMTPEEVSQAAGWESRAAEGTAHRALRERVAVLTDDQKVTAREMQESSGWPFRPKQKFDAFTKWVETCEKSNAAEGRPAETTEERSAAARQVLAEAEAKAGVHVPPDGPWGAEKVEAPLLNEAEDALVVCPECNESGTTEMTITHKEGCGEAPF